MLIREQILSLTLFFTLFPRPDHVTDDCMHLPGDNILADSVYIFLSQLCVDGISYLLLLVRCIGGVRLAWMGLDALFGNRLRNVLRVSVEPRNRNCEQPTLKNRHSMYESPAAACASRTEAPLGRWYILAAW